MRGVLSSFLPLAFIFLLALNSLEYTTSSITCKIRCIPDILKSYIEVIHIIPTSLNGSKILIKALQRIICNVIA